MMCHSTIEIQGVDTHQVMHPQWETLPATFVWTSNMKWDPCVLDHVLEDNGNWFDARSPLGDTAILQPFWWVCSYQYCISWWSAGPTFCQCSWWARFLWSWWEVLDRCINAAHQLSYEQYGTMTAMPSPCLSVSHTQHGIWLWDFMHLFLFCWPPTNVIKHTFKKTTQYTHMPTMSTLLKKCFKSSYLAHNVHCQNEPVAAKMVTSITPVIFGGETCAQLSISTESLITNIKGMKMDNQPVHHHSWGQHPSPQCPNSQSWLVVAPTKSRLATRFWTSFLPSAYPHGRVSCISTTKPLPNAAIRPSSPLQHDSWSHWFTHVSVAPMPS